MLFNSYEFIFVFLPVTVLLFLKFRQLGFHRPPLQFLLAASLFFYAWWNPKYLFLFAGSMTFNYSASRLLAFFRDREELFLQRLVLGIAIALNLFLIGYYKYGVFIAQNLSHSLGVPVVMRNVVLPIGISFFTFTQIAYLIDVHRRVIEGSRFTDFCLFLAFFPHLIAGPIVHYRELMPQFLDHNYTVRYRHLAVGLTFFVIGLFKKVVFADTISVYSKEAFDVAALGQHLDFFQAWGGVTAYSLQIYFDFSGYSDMAIGLGYLFGVKLPLNFNSPYKAVNIIEFWRRWHMSLSRFLLQYLYIPLGGNRKGPLRRTFNLMVTMLLGGLWHGAGWTYILWGGLHGIYLVGYHAWQSLKGSIGGFPSNAGSRCLARLTTLLGVTLAWVLFRSANLNTALSFYGSLFGANGFILPQPNFEIAAQMTMTLALLAVTFFLPNSQEWLGRFNPALDKIDARLTNKNFIFLSWRPTPLHAVFIGGLAAASFLFLYIERNSEFIYFQF